MRLIPDTLTGRTLMVLLIGLAVAQGLQILAYQINLAHELSEASKRHIGGRIAAARRAVLNLPPSADRDAIVSALSDAGLELHWSPASDLPPVGEKHWNVELTRDLQRLVPDLGATDLRISDRHALGLASPVEHLLLVSSELPDGSWVSARMPLDASPLISTWSLLMWAAASGLLIMILAAWSMRMVTAPLAALSDAAAELRLDGRNSHLPESGPREIRRAARAFNEMQERIRKLVADRTQMLAAISHDLKTPLTRLRLRAELLDDAELRTEMLADLEEMESMIGSTLAFLRGEMTNEQWKTLDLASMLATLCNDAADAGRSVDYSSEGSCPLYCRPVAMKRAFSNLIDNAVKYGRAAGVRLTGPLNGQARVEIADSGPGIPATERDKVFEPFYRIDASGQPLNVRGTGLGLTVAKAVITAHNGTIDLHDREGGGLRVVVTLPTAGLANTASPG
jgi:signal transduction histidine kinase